MEKAPTWKKSWLETTPTGESRLEGAPTLVLITGTVHWNYRGLENTPTFVDRGLENIPTFNG